MTILYAIFLSIWRRWFGGGWKDKLPTNRFLQHIVGFIVTACVLIVYGHNPWRAIVAAILLQALFWAVGHGAAFDMSRGGFPDAQTRKRYKKYFWNNWCEFLVPKHFWYAFGYDFLWMMFRYGLPAILISVILENLWFSFSALTVPMIYAISWSLSDRNKLKNLTAVALSELVVGFTTGILLLLG